MAIHPVVLLSGLFPTVQVSWLFVMMAPLPRAWRPEALGLFLVNMMLGAITLFLK